MLMQYTLNWLTFNTFLLTKMEDSSQNNAENDNEITYTKEMLKSKSIELRKKGFYYKITLYLGRVIKSLFDVKAIVKTKFSETLSKYKVWIKPNWTDRGGKNEALILDMEKSIEKAKYVRFLESEMDYNSIIPKSKATLKYPLYVCCGL